MGPSSDVTVVYQPEPLISITKSIRKKKRNAMQMVRFGVMALIGLLMIVPLLWMIITALLPLQEVFSYPPHLLPRHPQWMNWIKAWNYRPMGHYLFNSILVSGLIVCGQVITASLAAYALARIRFAGHKLAFWLIMLTLMVPTQVTFIPLFLTMKQLNWIDSYLGLIVPFIGSAFATFWLYQAFQQVPRTIMEAAEVDGASHFWIVFRIVLPLSKPSIISLMILNFVWHYNDFFWPLVVTQSDTMRTVPLGLSFMLANDGSGTPWNLVSAANIIAILPSLLLFIFGQKYFVSSAASSGVKG
ncbi:carbohydrate ABC transporter permease [Fodinisporobacter ferrooxydans]|uniref:Carbohydrate ABC transporter permease n=1 Tax=Fodinisporobacter ferrooxydans TaxID=2901836 RepID=A0ABY4CME6_9BACL|nr:carbohydrate ABC transporter permease [Alicyclobacillaceae bacterium MYW30-H2]